MAMIAKHIIVGALFALVVVLVYGRHLILGVLEAKEGEQ